MNRAPVELVGVTKRYSGSDHVAAPVDNISLAVEPGETVGICGASGTGKSTLLRVAAGVERPTSGAVLYGGEPAWVGKRRHARYPRPGYVMAVFQDPFSSLDPRWPVWKSLTEPLIPTGASRNERRCLAEAWLAKVHMDSSLIDAMPRELSGGQCQRVALCRAFVAKPALLVADEPTARLDVITAAAVALLLREAADDGMAVLVVSHHVSWLTPVADRIERMTFG